ncbi:MAG: hypothetical protein WCK70_12960 [Chloroflexales bacterium]|jgi:tetratricopeptide (TPR) repeat protein
MSSRHVRAKNPVLAIVIGILVLAALGGGGYWYFLQQQAEAQATNDAHAAATSVAQLAIDAVQTATSDSIQATSQAATDVAQATKTAQDAEIERQYQAAVAYQSAADYAQARTALRELIAAQPGYKDTADRLRQVNETLTEAYYQQGVAAVKEKVWGDALKNFDLALEITPNYKDIAAQRAIANRELNTTPTPEPSATPAPSATPDPSAVATVEPTASKANVTATAKPASDVAFRDTFDVTMSDKWQTVNPGLSVVDGHLAGSNGFLLYKPAGNDYTLATKVLGKRFAVIFRSDGKDGYTFYCKDGNCEWRTFRDGRPDSCCNTYSSLSSSFASAALADKAPHILTIEVRGKEFTAYVDGDSFLSIRDGSFTAGSVGLWVGDWTTFDNFEVTLH